MAMTKTMLDELTAGYKTPQEMEALYSQMLQHMINRSLEAEMQAHLGHERHGKASGNPRNGSSRKTVQSTVGDLQIETPRDREGTFEPQLLPKRQVRLAGMEEKILALYAKGMTTRDIESALMDLYGVTKNGVRFTYKTIIDSWAAVRGTAAGSPTCACGCSRR